MKQTAVINIGNTHTTAAWLELGGGLSRLVKTATSELVEKPIADCRIAPFLQGPCWLACVVPAARRRVAEVGSQACFLDFTKVSPAILDFSRVEGATVGADRIANALAAVTLQSPPVVVVDCGTAVTFEVVDGQRRFLGGAILPGRALQRKALHYYTGQLPEVELGDHPPEFPGRHTREAIQAGIDLGIAGAVKEMYERLRNQPALPGVKLLLTGGDAPFFAPLLPTAELMAPDFVLQGLATLHCS